MKPHHHSASRPPSSAICLFQPSGLQAFRLFPALRHYTLYIIHFTLLVCALGAQTAQPSLDVFPHNNAAGEIATCKSSGAATEKPGLNPLAAFAGAPVRPLASDFVVVGESPNPATIPLYNPTILALPNGRLVAGFFLSRKYDKSIEDYGMHFLTSDDRGLTWQHRANAKIGQARLIIANKILYALAGAGGTLVIIRSSDNGDTWSAPVVLAKIGGWHQSATNFIRAKGNIYLAIERRIGSEINAWTPGELSPILMRAKETDDLTKASSWTFSSELPFKELIPGYRSNNLEMDYFGVPFFPSNFPTSYQTARRRTCAPIGWLEANVAQITDTDHYWHDPAGKTFHILMRAHTGGTGYGALAKVVEHDDGTMTTMLETAPSGKKILFLPLPGGQMRFHITYDEKTKLYWLLGSQATDSMTRSEKLPANRYNLPNNERHRLVLHFSKNLVDWCFAGLVATGDSPGQARHYASMDIDGDDLVILSRSGDARAKNAHDGNIITFHRVKNFRNLVY